MSVTEDVAMATEAPITAIVSGSNNCRAENIIDLNGNTARMVGAEMSVTEIENRINITKNA